MKDLQPIIVKTQGVQLKKEPTFNVIDYTKELNKFLKESVFCGTIEECREFIDKQRAPIKFGIIP